MIKHQETVREVVKNIGLLDDNKIRKALDEQLNTGERLAKIMVKLGYIASENVGAALVPQIGMLPAAIKTEKIDVKTAGIIPANIATSHRVVPLKFETRTLLLATDDPLNLLSSGFFEKVTGLSVDMTLADHADIDKALAELYASKQKENASVDLSKLSEDIKEVKGDDDAPVIKLVNMLIEEALKRRASDIHVEPLEHKFRIRYRIDGVLHEIQGPPKRLQGSIISRLKIMAGMDIAEKRLPQDGRIKLNLESKEGRRPAVADILAYDPFQASDFFTVDKGGRQGVKVDDPVILAGSPSALGAGNILVGRVKEVGDKESRVLLITSAQSRITVSSQALKTLGVVTGSASGALALDLVLQDVDLQPGQILLTSGLDGIFPVGLLVGEVRRVSGGDGSSFKKASVRPFFTPRDLKQVFVLISQ